MNIEKAIRKSMKVNLAGTWSFSLDRANIGIDEKWYNKELSEELQLPGSLEENGVGDLVTERDIHQFNRTRSYVGAAWYQKEVEIHESNKDKVFSLFLERCLWETKVWVDDHYVGEQESLCVPHVHDLAERLTPGKHRITIRVDNSRKYEIGHRSHAYSEDQQSIWNGIVGRIELRAKEKLFIEKVQVYPNAQEKEVRFVVSFDNRTGASKRCTVAIASSPNTDQENGTQFERSVALSEGVSSSEFIVAFDGDIKLWDEFSPSLYSSTVSLISEEKSLDSVTETFGFRDFKTDGRVFRMNGRKTLLRGTHDGGCFPLTGYPSTRVEDWQRIFKIVKEYGLNHVRFHSYNPPEAAFIAGDIEGIILQTELPLFSISAPAIGDNKERDDFLRRELTRILDAVGNHPSFCMLAMGNELFGDYNILAGWVEEAKAMDPRHLYSTVSNNGLNCGPNPRPNESDEFFVNHNFLKNGKRMLRRCEDIFKRQPDTQGDYRETLENINIPTISHEVGQWEIYPNFKESEKLTGIFRAGNYEIFKDSIRENGLLHQADSFHQASGELVARLYREEIERSLRTPDYGGFQLLDIRDYHGQGTSTIGILDSFWDSKGLITSEEFRRSCDAKVLLARLPNRIFTNREAPVIPFEIANYGGANLENFAAEWALKTIDGTVLVEGILPESSVLDGSLSTLGEISLDLTTVTQPQKVLLEVREVSHLLFNSWELWVYPEIKIQESELIFKDRWDDSVEELLEQGKTVILETKNCVQSEGMGFTPPFWNTVLFNGQPKSMGLLCDPEHPLFKSFPTEFHANWQWFDLMHESRALNLSTGFDEITPIVQCIDHPVRNAKMSFIFEAKVGKGKLLCCGLNLSNEKSPVTARFKKSLIEYVQSDDFNPAVECAYEILKNVLVDAPSNWLKNNITKIEVNSEWWDSPVDNIIDGESSTYWISKRAAPYPHDITIELTEETVIWGARYTPRQDGLKAGWVKDYEVYISNDPFDWGAPVMEGAFPESAETQLMIPKLTDDGFNLTHSKKGKHLLFRILSAHDGGSEDAGNMLGSVAGFDLIVEQFPLEGLV